MNEYIDKNEAVDEGYLADWYIHSVAEYADEKLNEPRWTEKHIEELTQDFIVIPNGTPTADVAPVVHGHWLAWEEQFPEKKVPKKSKLGVFCSACRNHADNRSTFCPNCGAKMDGGTKHDKP